jgi:REP element-mobilizing transposase RayT
LAGYDYSQEGAYFVTICANEHQCLFGKVAGDTMRPGDTGRMVAATWQQLRLHYPGVDLDAFVIMPNHLHGIVILTVGAGPSACPSPGQPQGVAPTTTMSLSDVIHRFKSLTTARYLHAVRAKGWPPFSGRLWQRNYYEHIIRNEEKLKKVREYIADNPLQWAFDRENPAADRRGDRPVAPADDIEKIFGGVRP